VICPACHGELSQASLGAVTLDACAGGCGGIWLDCGELEAIRADHVSAADRHRAVVKAFEERAIGDRMALVDKQLDPLFPYATWRSRAASGALVALYLGLALQYFNPEAAVRLLQFCVVPIACVWFPDARGDSVGARITKKSPRSFVRCLGWVVLLLPVVVSAILFAEGVFDAR
jgi:Zn-finger nucleic acid-binding protein